MKDVSYFAIRRAVEPVHTWDYPVGTLRGGPSGTSQAPHLYFTRGKAAAKCPRGWEVVEVRLFEVTEEN